jgi:DNA-binding transcriptional LysR family regulator
MLKNIQLFTRVAETGSFTAVANEYSVGQPSVSKAVQSLERKLNLKLFHRNTRGLALTEEGEDAYAAGLRVLEAYDSLMHASRGAGVAQGMVKVAAPMALGALHLVPALKTFLADHPNLVVDLKLNDGFVDLITEGIDVALRVGEVKDSRLAVRSVGYLRRELVAGTGYLESHGVPQRPADLKNHQCIVHGTQYAHRQWALRKGGRTVTIAVSGNVVVDNILGIRAAVAQDMGIALVGKVLCADLVEQHRVERVLCDYEPDSLPVNILFPDNRYVPARVRRVIDFLAEAITCLLSGVDQPHHSRNS